jgi:hypothetical protein
MLGSSLCNNIVRAWVYILWMDLTGKLLYHFVVRICFKNHVIRTFSADAIKNYLIANIDVKQI